MSSEKLNSVTRSTSAIKILLIVILALVIFTVSLYFVSLSAGIEFPQLVSIVEIPASLAVSAILAYLYFRQANLMKGQQKLMELDYTPKLSLGELNLIEKEMIDRRIRSIDEIDINLDNSNSFPVENLSTSLRNLGEGVATELQINLNIVPIKPDFEQTRRYSALQRPLEPQDGHDYGYMSTGTMSRPLAEHHHNHLISGAHEKFKAGIKFRFKSNRKETKFVFLPFSCILELLRNQNVERARLQIDVDYSDTIKSEYTLSIVTIDFDLKNTTTLGDVLENGKIEHSTDIEESMTGNYTPTISEVNSWISSDLNKNN